MNEIAFVPFGGDEVPQSDYDGACVVVLPACYEHAVSYGTGTGTAPYHILNASLQLERLDDETLVDWGLLRIHTLCPMTPGDDPEDAVVQMKMAAEKPMAGGKFLLSLGGDHAVAIGPILAASKIFENLGVLQIDAHLDLRNEWHGSRYNHACVMRRVADEARLPFVPVGIRSIAQEESDFIRKEKIAPFFAHEIDLLDSGWIDQAVDRLPENVYLTLDLDGLDPSAVPGTGTPEPGGLSFRQVVALIKAVGSRRRVVGADICELSKIPGFQVSEYTAAKIATKILIHCAPSSPLRRAGRKSQEI